MIYSSGVQEGLISISSTKELRRGIWRGNYWKPKTAILKLTHALYQSEESACKPSTFRFLNSFRFVSENKKKQKSVTHFIFGFTYL